MRGVARMLHTILIYFVHASHRIMDCGASVVFETAPVKIKSVKTKGVTDYSDTVSEKVWNVLVN
jgi:hypothetical protein